MAASIGGKWRFIIEVYSEIKSRQRRTRATLALGGARSTTRLFFGRAAPAKPCTRIAFFCLVRIRRTRRQGRHVSRTFSLALTEGAVVQEQEERKEDKTEALVDCN